VHSNVLEHIFGVLADEKAAIPMAGEITSLNVSVASAVLMYEAVRQRIAK
jgi:23S rRNA (guanosine2251-2'-O)-methyltransferase